MTDIVKPKSTDQKIDDLLELTLKANREILPKWWKLFVNIASIALLLAVLVLLKNAIYNPDKSLVLSLTSFFISQ